MLRTLIIDDEIHNRDTYRKLLELNCPQVTVVGEASSVVEGIKAIRKLAPDLVLLDFNLSDGNGLDLLQSIDKINFRVIFISAVECNPLKQLIQTGVRFLSKPVNPEKLVLAIGQRG